MKFEFAGKTLKGVRDENQDNFTVFYASDKSFLLAAVADGMGGHRGGKFASEFTINILEKEFSNLSLNNFTDDQIRNLMSSTIRKIEIKFIELVQKQNAPYDMGTTINWNIFFKDKLFTLNIGDSRISQYYKKKITAISEDHNLATLAKKDYNFRKYINYTNYLTSSLGAKKETRMDIFTTQLKHDGYFFITSDGVHNFVKSAHFKKIFKSNSDINKKVEKILNLAIQNDSNDNVTCVVVKYGV